MTTISGSALGSPSGITLQNLIDRTQNILSDVAEATWSEAELAGWLNDAIRDYSLHFHRLRTTTITTTADDRKYDLPADFIAPLSIEYPTDEDPPEYLQRRSYAHIDFWSQDGYYDVVDRNDDQNVAVLWISEKPSNSETITIEYQATHDHGLAVSEYLTVPGEHHHILIAYAVWRASQALQLAEQQSPTSNSSLLMAQMGQNNRLLKQEYLDALAKAINAAAGSGSGVVVWTTAETENIY